ncbi:DUF2778 domain-containing protein [Enterovirga sp. DB1703]|uniref:DUF2778 domain-containing protein n=2 Tax=Enterovirga aerilata TaxID=2730920 RepID=A0A849IFF8_9HYPH|nr:DUF2778 domain-containing protein [Enterovirga sp. DB1703]
MLSAPPGPKYDPETTGSIPKQAFAVDPSLLDPTPMLGKGAAMAWSSAPLGSGLLPPRPAAAPALAAPAKAEPASRPAPAPSAASPEPMRSSHAVPLPVPRPADLTPREAAASVARAPSRAAPRRMRTAAVPSPQPDDRSWFEKLFDLNAPGAPGVSYAALDSRPVEVAPRARQSPSPLPTPAGEPGVAVYDISARTVTLPNGERLEAHSGLREKMDDPRFVHVRMRGATPPGTYDLTEREAPFHGVRAIRLNPVGGSAAIFGRAGLLAHTYLLGPNGDSNGCVSLKDYDRFLQAFLRGEIRRLVVVAGNRQDWTPSAKRFGRSDRDDPRARDV